MANQYPYVSSAGSIGQALEQFRKKLPQTIDSDTLKQLELAPNNESYLINVLKFIGIVDEAGKADSKKSEIFYADDTQYIAGLSELIEAAYSSLFDLHGAVAWNLDKGKLTSFFRQADKTSEIVGGRQTNTFVALAVAAKKRDGVEDKGTSNGTSKPKKSPKPTVVAKKTTVAEQTTVELAKPNGSPVSLNVRIEVVLPSNSTKETYDNIFKSIRENLID